MSTLVLGGAVTERKIPGQPTKSAMTPVAGLSPP
jgi:hypothetical protein